MKKIFFLAMIAIFIISGCNLKKSKKEVKILTPEEAKTQAVEFINKNLVQPGNNVNIKDITEENGFYKITVILTNGQEIVAGLSKDGTKFFPQVMDVAQVTKENEERNNQANRSVESEKKAENAPKKDKPVVELFVMSHCPYGTQIEKGILPVLDILKGKIDFQLKFVDYAMHGEKEIDEQIKQYCISKNENNKLTDYLKCFLKNSDTASCLKTAKIDEKKLNTCFSETDKKFKIKEKFTDKSKWPTGNFPPFDIHKIENDKYGIQGSPTLVINGVKINSGRDPKSLLNTICATFNNQPTECQKQLSDVNPSPGFGEGSGDSNADGGCGN